MQCTICKQQLKKLSHFPGIIRRRDIHGILVKMPTQQVINLRPLFVNIVQLYNR